MGLVHCVNLSRIAGLEPAAMTDKKVSNAEYTETGSKAWREVQERRPWRIIRDWDAAWRR